MTKNNEAVNEKASVGVVLERFVSNFSSFATHKHVIFGTLFQLSKNDDDFPDLAWWYNEAANMWQVSNYTNDEVKYGKQFELI